MRLRELIKEEGYDKERDADAVSGKPRRNNFKPGASGGKPKGYSKDDDEKAAVDNIKKSLAKESATGMGAASVASSMGGGNGFVNGGIGTVTRAGTASKKRKKKRSQ